MPEQPFEPASESEMNEVKEKLKELAPLMNVTETQLKRQMNISNKLSSEDAEEAIMRLENGINYYKNKKKDDE